MCLTQLIKGGGDEDTVKKVLEAEYKLLCIADYLKSTFNNWTKNFKTVVIPSTFT